MPKQEQPSAIIYNPEGPKGPYPGVVRPTATQLQEFRKIFNADINGEEPYWVNSYKEGDAAYIDGIYYAIEKMGIDTDTIDLNYWTVLD